MKYNKDNREVKINNLLLVTKDESATQLVAKQYTIVVWRKTPQ